MRIIAVFLTFYVFCETFAARNVTFDSFQYSPEESDLIDYGSLRLKKAKTKNIFTLNGNFTFKRTLGNEKIITIEILSRQAVLVRNVHPFCQFIKTEKLFWPDLLDVSNMPKNNPCPFPAVRLLMKFHKQFLMFSLRATTPSTNSPLMSPSCPVRSVAGSSLSRFS